MVFASGVLLVGLASPIALRASSLRGAYPRSTIAGYVAGLLLVWTGLLGVVLATAAPGVGFFELCQALATAPLSTVDSGPTVALLVLASAVPIRALLQVVRSVLVGADLRRRLDVSSGSAGVVEASLPTVAYTVGVLRPRVVVDPVRLAALPEHQQRAVLAHEQGHVRGLHGLIDLVTRSLAAGLAPWPGGRIAVAEVRRQLEAAADDRAAGRTDRRTTAGAIVSAACGRPPAIEALGAVGWTVWRVDRLLDRAAPDRRGLVAAVGLLALVGVVGGHGVVHVLSGLDIALLRELCCVA